MVFKKSSATVMQLLIGSVFFIGALCSERAVAAHPECQNYFTSKDILNSINSEDLKKFVSLAKEYIRVVGSKDNNSQDVKAKIQIEYLKFVEIVKKIGFENPESVIKKLFLEFAQDPQNQEALVRKQEEVQRKIDLLNQQKQKRLFAMYDSYGCNDLLSLSLKILESLSISSVTTALQAFAKKDVIFERRQDLIFILKTYDAKSIISQILESKNPPVVLLTEIALEAHVAKEELTDLMTFSIKSGCIAVLKDLINYGMTLDVPAFLKFLEGDTGGRYLVGAIDIGIGLKLPKAQLSKEDMQILMITAIKHGRIDSIKRLLDYGLTLDVTEFVKLVENDKFGNSLENFIDLAVYAHLSKEDMIPLLMSAAKHGNISLVKRLLKLGLDIDAQDANGNTASHLAIINSEESAGRSFKMPSDLLTLLLQAKPNVNLVNKEGRTPLMESIATVTLRALLTDQVRRLLEAGADNESRDSSGMTSLHYAVLTRDHFVIKLFADHKLNLNLADKNGLTPLEYSLKMRNEDAATLLLDAGVNVPAKNTAEGRSLLNYAKALQNKKLVERILQEMQVQHPPNSIPSGWRGLLRRLGGG